MNTTVAKKGVGKLFSATKSTLSVLSNGISKAKKEYASNHEYSVLLELNQKGFSPADLLYQAFQRFYFLYLAGYKHELIAAAQTAGQRLTDSDKSSVPLDVVSLMGNSVYNESKKYGDFEKGKFTQSMQDILTKSRAVRNNYDRDTIAHDMYYAVLFTVENYGTHWQSLEKAFRDSTSQIIGTAVPGPDRKTDPREKAAKAMYLLASEIKLCCAEAESKRRKALKEAEDLLRKESENTMKLNPVAGGPLQITDSSSIRRK